ncbi:MAG TPA: pitrilysin family protein [Vicinamibacterales bacterium]|jgi:predicted Zn-dependent peptidase|nr:pitrilysin family protein [Vicinamibacterales bacterium]
MRRAILVVIGALAVAAASLSAITPPSVKFTDTKLKNGLRLIVAEDHVAPVFSIAVVYNVGSRDERKGRTGFAHLFEHMMFKGSQNVGPGEHFYTVFSNGGTMNGTTDKERTLYYDTMPANQLEAAMFLEADRMRSLAIVKENLDNQRNAVQEERRQGLDNRPYGRTDEAVDDLAFDNPAYKHSVIGSMEDLGAASTADVASFFQTYYAPNNAIMAVAGDVTTANVQELARKYFESIPSQPAPPVVDVSQPPQNGERRLALEDALARLPRLDVSYRIPSNLSADDDAIDVLRLVMSAGRSSRLYESIVRQKQLAVSANAFAFDSRGPRLLRIIATPTPGRSIDDLEAAIYAEVERLKTGPIADWEIEKARNDARRQFVGSLGQSVSRAIDLAEYGLIYNDPGQINKRWDRLAKLTAADVQRVAKQYLTPDNRSVIVTRPKAAAGRGGL